MKKIGFFSTMNGVPWGGSEELWCGAASRLLERGGVRVGACTFWWPQPVSQLQMLEGQGALLSTWGRTVDYSARARLRRLPSIVRRRLLRRSVPDWLEAFQPDLVVFSLGAAIVGPDGLRWLERCAALGIPYAILVQAASEMMWPGDDVLLAHACVYEAARAVFFVSEGNLLLSRRQFASALGNAEVVHNPFCVARDAAPDWPDENNGYNVACVGRLDAWAKGQDVLMEVLRQDKWRTRPLHVTFYGRGRNEESLRRLAQRYNLSNVEFAGHVSDVTDIWARNHALAMPSRMEGLPLALVEGMLCGRMAVVSDVGGNAEVVTDGATGFVAPAPTPALFDDALERAWARRAEWQQMGQAAAEAIRALVPADPAAVFADRLLTFL